MAAGKSDTAGEARTKGDRVEPAGRKHDLAHLTGTGIAEVKPTLMQPRRMWHCQAAGYDLVAADVDEAAIAGPRLAPGAWCVGPAGGSQEPRPAVLHRQAVQMAPVLGA